MARFFQGRMRYPSYVGGRRHPRAGRPHPFLYAGARNRRTFAHKYFGTQPTGYGLRGGDPRTSGVSGAAGRVYRHMLGGAMRPQRGTGYRTSHQLGHYRSGLSKAGKDAYANFMGGRTRHDFGSGREFRAARSQARRERSQARRGYARDYKNPYTGTGHRRFTKVSHRDPGTGIRRNYFGGFTGNLSQGSRNLIDRRRKQLQGASQRYQWGVKNPGRTNISLGGYRHMSPKFHKRLEAAQRGGELLKGVGRGATGFLDNLRKLRNKQVQSQKSRNFHNMTMEDMDLSTKYDTGGPSLEPEFAKGGASYDPNAIEQVTHGDPGWVNELNITNMPQDNWYLKGIKRSIQRGEEDPKEYYRELQKNPWGHELNLQTLHRINRLLWGKNSP